MGKCENKLPCSSVWPHLSLNSVSLLQRSPRSTRWTKPSALAAKSNHPFRLATLTVKPDKTVFQDSATLISLKFRCHMRGNGLLADRIVNLNLWPSPSHRLIQDRRLWPVTLVDRHDSIFVKDSIENSLNICVSTIRPLTANDIKHRPLLTPQSLKQKTTQLRHKFDASLSNSASKRGERCGGWLI